MELITAFARQIWSVYTFIVTEPVDTLDEPYRARVPLAEKLVPLAGTTTMVNPVLPGTLLAVTEIVAGLTKPDGKNMSTFANEPVGDEGAVCPAMDVI
jgi:hypothetical protein